METTKKKTITIQTTVMAPVAKVWKYWSEPAHVTKWNNASEDWHTPKAENDLRTGGKFSFTMAAKDGSMSFDFGGEYTNVKQHELIEYTMGDGRTVQVIFTASGDQTKIVETFEMESMNSEELQRSGWQAILDNFKKYTETN